MKLKTLACWSLVLLGSAAFALADQTTDKPATSKSRASVTEQKAVSKPKKQKAEQRTGSNVARCIHRYGMITDGPYNLSIIDENMIKQSGASTVAQVLNRYGVRH